MRSSRTIRPRAVIINGAAAMVIKLETTLVRKPVDLATASKIDD
jgi:hypothetical protein